MKYCPTFRVFDTLGYLMGEFKTWKEAYTFKISRSRYDWVIKPYYY